MAQERLDWPNLDAIWISHFHLDHMGGLAPFLFGSRVGASDSKPHQAIANLRPEGLRRIIDAMNDSNNYKLFQQAFPVEIVEVGPGTEFEIIPGLAASILSTPHTEESLALRLKAEDSKLFVYTSDTGFSEDLVPFAKDVDLLLMECSFRRNKPIQKHLELVEAMNLARECAPETTCLDPSLSGMG